jgi:hypothetical protein
MSKLTHVDTTPREAVQVISDARPHVGVLRQVRKLVQSRTDLREVLALKDQNALEALLAELLPDETQYMYEVAKYLLDEYEQLGDVPLLISTVTGKAIARLTEDNFWRPNAVPRESGNMTQRTPQLRPEFEASLLMHEHAKARDEELREIILAREQEALRFLRVDPDLLFGTRSGRKATAQKVHESLPAVLQSATGLAQEFLSLLAISTKASTKERGTMKRIEVNPIARVVRAVNDPLAQNLAHSVFHSSLAVIAAAWARELAREAFVHSKHETANLKVCSSAGTGLIVGSPNTVSSLRGRILPVDVSDEVVMCPQSGLGELDIDESSYEVTWREVHDKWVLEASFRGVLWVNLEHAPMFEIKLGAPSYPVAEVVS